MQSQTPPISQSVPRDAQALGSDIKGRIVLRGRSKRHESQLDSSRITTPGEEEEEEEEEGLLESVAGQQPRRLLDYHQPLQQPAPAAVPQPAALETSHPLRAHKTKIRSKLRRKQTGWRHSMTLAARDEVDKLEFAALDVILKLDGGEAPREDEGSR